MCGVARPGDMVAKYIIIWGANPTFMCSMKYIYPGAREEGEGRRYRPAAVARLPPKPISPARAPAHFGARRWCRAPAPWIAPVDSGIFVNDHG